MKNWSIFILSLALYTQGAPAATQVLDKITAVINNSVVLKSDVDNMLSMIKRSAQKTNKQLPDDASLRLKILDQLIMDNIILQLAKRANITITDEKLDQAIGNIATQNYMDIDQLRNRLAYEGINYNTYRAQVCKAILISEVRNSEVRRRITILPHEVDALAQQIAAQTSNEAEFNLSHIMIPLPENPTKEQLDKAEALANTLGKQKKNSLDLKKLTINYSADQQALKDIQMGWKKIEDLPSLFAKHVQGAQKGSIVGPIRSNVGLHILTINDIRGGDQKVIVTEAHARHILLRTSVVRTDQQAQNILEDIATQIKSGHISFSTAAKQLSEDPSSANQGGDLGWSATNAFDVDFRDALMHLKKGEISTPVNSSFGWHLIQLIDTRQVDRTDAVQKDQAYWLLFNRKFVEEEQKWMQEQLTSSYVKIIDNNG